MGMSKEDFTSFASSILKSVKNKLVSLEFVCVVAGAEVADDVVCM